jgi:UPF0042 nucleotide-binding protein
MYNISLVVLTGLSGSGKSVAVKTLEDLGYYTIDNMPLLLADKLMDIIFDFNVEVSKLALVIDSRSKDYRKAYEFINQLKDRYSADVLFLEAEDDEIIKRYKETRRKHPLGESLPEAILSEREYLKDIREISDIIINTTGMNVHQLGREIEKYFKEPGLTNIYITVQSFGFKYGIPTDSDMLLDVRFLKNPYFVDELKHLTGLDKRIKEYVFSDKRSRIFLTKLKNLLLFLIPNYINEGKKLFTISLGCTGGKHRSVVLASYIGEYIEKKYGKSVNIKHRDIDR